MCCTALYRSVGAPADHHRFTLTCILRAFALRGLIERFEATLIDALGRRSYTTSIAFGPPLGKNIALAYLPHADAQVGRELQIQ